MLVAVGLWVGRRVETTGTFFVADRGLSPALLFATVLAANIGAGSTVGAAGLGYRDGLAGVWWVGSAAIGSAVLAVAVGPRIWRIARERGLHTVGDYLELRYGSAARATIAALLWLGTLAILAGQLIAFAWILAVVADVPKWVGCLIGGAVMTVYFTAGGLLTSAWVNLVQLVVLIAGFGLALPWVVASAGGLRAILAAAPADHLRLWSSGGSGWPFLLLLGPAFVVSPGLLQKVYGARDERAVRVGVGANALALLVFAAVPPLLGLAAWAFDPHLANPELALPTALVRGMPAALGSVALAAVFSAEISSADAILFMLATSLSEDLYKRYLRPDASDRAVLAVARGAAVAGGGLGVVLAVLLPSVVSSLSIFYSLLSVSLFVPVVAGLYSRRAGLAEALAAIAAGVAVLLVVRWFGPSLGLAGWNPNLAGLVASGVLFSLVLLARARRAAPQRSRKASSSR